MESHSYLIRHDELCSGGGVWVGGEDGGRVEDGNFKRLTLTAHVGRLLEMKPDGLKSSRQAQWRIAWERGLPSPPGSRTQLDETRHQTCGQPQRRQLKSSPATALLDLRYRSRSHKQQPSYKSQ